MPSVTSKKRNYGSKLNQSKHAEASWSMSHACMQSKEKEGIGRRLTVLATEALDGLDELPVQLLRPPHPRHL